MDLTLQKMGSLKHTQEDPKNSDILNVTLRPRSNVVNTIPRMNAASLEILDLSCKHGNLAMAAIASTPALHTSFFSSSNKNTQVPNRYGNCSPRAEECKNYFNLTPLIESSAAESSAVEDTTHYNVDKITHNNGQIIDSRSPVQVFPHSLSYVLPYVQYSQPISGVISKVPTEHTRKLTSAVSAEKEFSTSESNVKRKSFGPYNDPSILNKNSSELLHGCDDGYFKFREQMMEKIVKRGNERTTNSKMRRASNRSGSPTSTVDEKDAAYWERRRKNNEAAKRSRDLRRAKEDELMILTTYLQHQNNYYRNVLDVLINELRKENINVRITPNENTECTQNAHVKIKLESMRN